MIDIHIQPAKYSATCDLCGKTLFKNTMYDDESDLMTNLIKSGWHRGKKSTVFCNECLHEIGARLMEVAEIGLYGSKHYFLLGKDLQWDTSGFGDSYGEAFKNLIEENWKHVNAGNHDKAAKKS